MQAMGMKILHDLTEIVDPSEMTFAIEIIRFEGMIIYVDMWMCRRFQRLLEHVSSIRFLLQCLATFAILDASRIAEIIRRLDGFDGEEDSNVRIIRAKER